MKYNHRQHVNGGDYMQGYKFPRESDWVLYIENGSQWGIGNPLYIVAVLDIVKRLYERLFGYERVNSLSIFTRYQSVYPEAHRGSREIFLNATVAHWAQFIYQFSHEVCHHVIGEGTPQHLCWFEESICEMASLFFLHHASLLWHETPPFEEREGFSIHIAKYFEDEKKRIPKTIAPIIRSAQYADFYFKHADYLTSERYNRCYNRLFAVALLPLFLATPSLWLDIINISGTPKHASFPEALHYLFALSANKDAFQDVIYIFNF